jgi:hypothetical protein
MSRTKLCLSVLLLLICSAVSLCAQQAALAASAVVPPVVKLSGVLTDTNNKPLTAGWVSLFLCSGDFLKNS